MKVEQWLIGRAYDEVVDFDSHLLDVSLNWLQNPTLVL